MTSIHMSPSTTESLSLNPTFINLQSNSTLLGNKSLAIHVDVVSLYRGVNSYTLYWPVKNGTLAVTDDITAAINGQTKETWTFTLADGTTTTKTIVLG